MPDSSKLFEQKLISICKAFEANWSPDHKLDLEPSLRKIDSKFRRELTFMLVECDIDLCKRIGQLISSERYAKYGDHVVAFASNILSRSIDPTQSAGHSSDDPFLTKDFSAANLTDGSRPNRTIGPYHLVKQIGEGGMGAVWLAEQHAPIKRQVALKLIRGTLDSEAAVLRFEAERQALAMMQHQNIAKILDAGTTNHNTPYFVMEFIDGIPITEYCDQNRLSVQERLEVFLPICQAVQHAHLKGIIHRDLKPSNILVARAEGLPVPKVIDFGLAKALNQATKLVAQSVHTQIGTVVGTLQYMAPEQAGAESHDVDVRSDIYSLGIILFELLTGSTPLEKEFLQQKAVLQLIELIKNCETPRPSTRLNSAGISTEQICKERKTAPSKLRNILRGDLDWIVLKALEKNPGQRYETVKELSGEISAFLNDEPIKARPPSIIYRTRKTIRKHRKAFSVALIMIGVTAVLASGLIWQRRESNRLLLVEKSKSGVESLKATYGPGVPEVLKSLDELPENQIIAQLEMEFKSARDQALLNMAYGLAKYERVEIETLVNGLIADEASHLEVPNIIAALDQNRSRSLEFILKHAQELRSKHQLAKMARLAILAIHLGEPSLARSMTAYAGNPVQRVAFINEFRLWSGSLARVATLLKESEDGPLRTAICLSLGEMNRVNQETKNTWHSILTNWYVNACDGATHSAAGQVLNKWDLPCPILRPQYTEPIEKDWWQALGVKLVRVPQGKFESQTGPVKLEHRFWISDCEITEKVYKVFLADSEFRKRNSNLRLGQPNRQQDPTDPLTQMPAQGVSWYNAILFCNWLSWKMNLQPCYEISLVTFQKNEIGSKLELKDGIPTNKEPYNVTWNQKANGFRLPTKHEWEYACRANTITRYCFGDNEDFLGDYAWWIANSNSRIHEVRRKRCNDWGLFDVHGNLSEWCFDHWSSRGRVLRGGQSTSGAATCESSYSGGTLTTAVGPMIGFRIVKSDSKSN